MKERSNILPFPDIQRQWALDRVRELAGNTRSVNWTMHFLERADEREITLRQVIAVMREGQLAEDPVRDEFGGWKVTLQRHCAGRLVRVVVAISDTDELFIVTAM